MSGVPLTAVILESIPVFLVRAGLFYTSRKYLLRSLYHDLKDLSTDTETYNPVSTQDDDDTVELDSLPVTSPSTKNHAVHTRKRTFHSLLSRTLFSLSFSESCTLFILLMFQGLDILHARTRLFNWNLSLAILLLSITALIPLSYSLVLSYRSSSLSQTLQRPTVLRLLLTTLPVGLFLFALSFVPLPEGVSPGPTVKVLWRLIVVGTVLLGLLSGFGAVNNAWIFFPRLSGSRKNQPTDEDVRIAERGLERIRNDLAERRKAIERLEASQPKSDGSWISRVMPTFGGSSELSAASQEINGLMALEYQMSRNLETLRSQQAQVKFSQTIRGKLFNFGGRLFALYCVYRIVVSTVNLILPIDTASPTQGGADGASRLDFLTMALARVVSVVPWIHWETADIAVIARQISLGMVGVIILSSIRLVLRGVARVLRVTSRNLGASLMLLMLAQLMGIYLLSTLIQLRTSFPPPPSRPDTEPDNGTINLFSTLPEYQVFGSLFDGSFLLAAAASAVILWFDERINGSGVTSDV
ncbi:unnamed protein product [Somion occarium]|uniref:G protein-coupled receptor 89 n=1 Tax=Somion occarium TaxID=3059160 RepID=A0ABP1CUR7_9APHY